MKRRYGNWAGNPEGKPEVPEHCVAEVRAEGRWPVFHQCSRKRGHGPCEWYCRQHAKILERGGHVSVPPGEAA